MPKKTWSCLFSALLTTFSSVAFGFHTTSVKAEPEAQLKVLSTASPATKVEAKLQDSSDASPVLKVGETRSQSIARSQNDAIARIYPHVVRGRSAATVYVRNIPVFTFLGSNSSENSRSKALSPTKLPSNVTTTAPSAESKNPVERATAVAASINQLKRDGLNASTINPVWESGHYAIKFGDKATVKFDRNVVFSDTLADRTEDVLGATNLLRRLMGDAPPVGEIANGSQRSVGASVISRAVQVFSGMASWYGPGFSGNYSASGELFNQYDLTAAHRSLPFGTAVRVTNVDNGRSVVVRINDRGPFAHGRVIDLSTAAAQVIGLISAGVAPVKLEVLPRP